MKKINRKQQIIAIIVIIIVGIFLYSTQIANSFKMEDAIAMAKSYVPKNSTLIEKEKDHGEYELTFRNNDYFRVYEITVNKARKGISNIEIYSESDPGNVTVKLTESEIKDLLNETFNHLTEINVNLVNDEGYYQYETSFKSKRFYGEALINPDTGFIMELKMSYLRKAVPTDSDFNFDEKYEPEKKTPLDKASENSNKSNNINSSQSSDIIPRGNCQTTITEEEAIKIVKSKLPGIKIKEIKLDRETIGYVYEGEGRKGDYEYEFELNGKSGEIIQWEKELIEKDDATY